MGPDVLLFNSNWIEEQYNHNEKSLNVGCIKEKNWLMCYSIKTSY